MEPSGNPSSSEENEPSSLSLAFIEGLYEDFLRDPDSVPEEWRSYFRNENGTALPGAVQSHEPIVAASYSGDKNPVLDDARKRTQNCNVCGRNLEITALQYQVDMLIRN